MKYALFAALLVTGTAHAERFSKITGDKLIEICSSSASETCTAYIDGVSDAASLYQKLRPINGSRGPRLPAYLCVPTEATGMELKEIVVSFGHSHTGFNTAERLVLDALRAKWPCTAASVGQ